MNRFSLALAAVAAALLVPAAALAKGPSQATISGPGLGNVKFSGGEVEGSPLMQFAEHTGFFPAVFTQQPDPMLSGRPHVALGPKYTIRYVVPGPNGGTFRLTQDAYPYAAGGSVTYMKPGQRVFAFTTRGGWYRDPALKQTLVERGLPARAPKASSSGRKLAFLVGAPVALLLGGGAALFARRRRS